MVAVYCRRKCGFSRLFFLRVVTDGVSKNSRHVTGFQVARRHNAAPLPHQAKKGGNSSSGRKLRSQKSGSRRDAQSMMDRLEAIGCGCAGSGGSKRPLLLVGTESGSWTPTFSAWRFVYVENSDTGQSMNGMRLATLSK